MAGVVGVRDLGRAPGKIVERLEQGEFLLLTSRGAPIAVLLPVTASGRDVRAELPIAVPAPSIEVTPAERRILDVVTDAPMAPDRISQLAGIPHDQTSVLLSRLEVRGLLHRQWWGTYELSKKAIEWLESTNKDGT